MRIANFNNNLSMVFDIYNSLASSIKKTFKDKKMSNYDCAINDQTNNI